MTTAEILQHHVARLRSAFSAPALMLVALVLVGCGGDGRPSTPGFVPGTSSGAGNPPPPPPPPPDPQPDRNALVGDPDSPARAAVADIDFPPPAPGNVAESGVVLDRLGVLLSADATVRQVNEALALIDAQIGFASRQSMLMTLLVPLQPAPLDIEALAERLEAAPGIAASWPQRALVRDMLPSGTDGSTADPLGFSHLLPARFPAAWNAAGLLAGCESRPVPVVVVDHFDETIPADFFSYFPAASFVPDSLPRVTNPRGTGMHGYQVALAMSAAHDTNGPTGANPRADCLRVEALDVSQRGGPVYIEALRDRLANLGNENAVVQISLGDTIALCGEQGDTQCDSQFGGLTAARLRHALQRRIESSLVWARIGLSPQRVDRVLFTTAAGNNANKNAGMAYRGFSDARFNLFPQAIAHLPILRAMYANESFGVDLWTAVDTQGNFRFDLPRAHLPADQLEAWQGEFDALDVSELVDLRNVITTGAIENQPPNTFPATALELQRSRFSNDRAMVHAVGESVAVGLPDPETGSDQMEGTSYAAPQVAGLAAYLWLLSDELRALPVAETKRLIMATMQRSDPQPAPDDDAQGAPAPLDNIVDAYAAVLALDRPNEPRRIRTAILDVNRDGRFTEADIQRYLEAFDEYEALAPAEGDPVPDFSRFDLNGDGVTGSVQIMPMDLDGEQYDTNGSPVLETISVNIEGIFRNFDERVVTDLQALCFFAYDPLLFDGSRDARRDLLAERCVPPFTIEAIFPEVIAGRGPLSVLVTRPDEDTNLSTPVPDLLVGFTSSCGVLYDADGLPGSGGRIAVRTSAQGIADISVAVDEGTACTNRVSVAIEALPDSETGYVAARSSVSAIVFSGTTPSAFGTYLGTQVCTQTRPSGTSTCTAPSDDLVLSERFNSAGNLCGREVCISPPRGCLAQSVFSADISNQSPFELSFSGSASRPVTDGSTLQEQLIGTVTRLETPPRVVLSQSGEQRSTDGTVLFSYSCTFEGEKLR